MANVRANRVHVETTSSGTADLGLGSAISTAYQSFSGASVPDGSTFSYVAYTATQFECGRGAYVAAGPTLDRTAANVVAGSAGAGALTNFSSNPRVFIGPLAEDGAAPLTLTLDDAVNNAVSTILTLAHTTSGTPAAGIGAGMNFTVETAAGNNEIGAVIEAVTTDVTSTSEDFDLVFKLMTAGAAASAKLRITSDGYVQSASHIFAGGTLGSVTTATAALAPDYATNGLYLGSAKEIVWSSASTLAFGGDDLHIGRDAANVLAQRNSTNAQTFRVYNTYTDASNYERGVFDWGTTANTLTIGAQAGGSGTARDVAIVKGTNTFVTTATTTVASLPTAGTVGRKHFVTDANATTFATVVAGGGSNGVPVYDDGTNWRIG